MSAALIPSPAVELERPAADAVRAALADALSPHTRRAYTSAWRAWNVWSEARGYPPLPAAPEHVAAYLTERAAAGASVATLRMATAAIRAAHEAASLASPTAHPAIAGRRGVLAGLAKRAARERPPARQAKALTAEALAAIRATAATPRKRADGRMERPATARRRAITDLALTHTLADAGLRRSEAAALTWADVADEADGSGILSVRRSKTDAAGAGAVAALTPRAMRFLTSLRESRPDAAPEHPVFGLSPEAISRRIAAAALAAGLGSGYSGHSGRVGMARRMSAAGAPDTAIMRQGRWASAGMVARYTRAERAASALQWLTDGGAGT